MLMVLSVGEYEKPSRMFSGRLLWLDVGGYQRDTAVSDSDDFRL